MNIKVRLIGRYRDIAGKDEIELNVKGNTIWDVVNEFVKKHPLLKKDKKFIMVSRNKVYTTFEDKIEEGDVIMISPPVVSGG